ncbi:inositol-trisphosphate 3-kinase homolog isoform X2 [Daphnia carinata]|uniref:inositol-trisphosphate 3-kinase homolog isoform X2 n=1 Tax=Daphnia carinata TaxID=120202 RepID=UPI00257BB4F0|nr:inositol-trisphosphate 3-kinase homolog isoform X2 [Daphnia carinata]
MKTSVTRCQDSLTSGDWHTRFGHLTGALATLAYPRRREFAQRSRGHDPIQTVLSLARMEVEQRFPRMQLVRKAAEQYQRLIMDCTRPTLAIHQQQSVRDANGSATSIQQHKRVGGGTATKHGIANLRKWRPSRNGFKASGVPASTTTHISAKADSSAKDSPTTGRHTCYHGDMTMLQLLAFNALDLSAPATDVLLKNRRSSWVQLSGHPGSFAPAGLGTLWKKQGSDNNEQVVYEALMKDSASDIVPKYYRDVSYQGESFIEMQDLLHGFTDPNVIDIKMGTRTFLESEVTNTAARSDLYQKMVKVDPTAPTREENELQAVTKLRYMTFREQQSSSCSLGFRIEAIKFQGKPPVSELKTVQTREAVQSMLKVFLGRGPHVRNQILSRLKHIRQKFQESPYFQTHEVVGSSILIIYDSQHVGAWVIDFAKTLSLPDGVSVSHRQPWQQGNHEEGWLTGIDNLIQDIEALHCDASNAKEMHLKR